MRLEIDDEEQRLLCDLLDRHYRELLWELARTDHSFMKAVLRDQVSVLERLIEKAQATEPTAK